MNDKVTASTQVDSLLPNYIYDNYSNFVNFMEHSMKSQERLGFGQDILQNLQKYRDFDTYKDGIVEYNTLAAAIDADDDELELVSGFGFPERDGVILLDDEVILYHSREGNILYGLQRGAAATTVLPTLRSDGHYAVTKAAAHGKGVQVQNLSVLFLVAMLSTIHESFTPNISSDRVSKQVNRSSLLQNIRDFFASKGSELGIQALFKMLFAQNDVEVSYPGDRMVKTSDSTWADTALLRVVPIPEALTNPETTWSTPERAVGNIVKLINYNNKEVLARLYSDYVSIYPFQDTVQYEFSVEIDSVNGDVRSNPSTSLTRALEVFGGTDDRDDVTTITVESTIGFPEAGYVFIDGEGIQYTSKTANQFLGCSRGAVSLTVDHKIGAKVWGPYYLHAEWTVDGETFSSDSWPLGLVDQVDIVNAGLLMEPGDEITPGGPGMVDPENHTLNSWIENYDDELATQENVSHLAYVGYIQENGSGLAYVGNYTKGVSGVYFDEKYVYVMSSNLPSYEIESFSTDGSVGGDLKGENACYVIPQRNSIRKNEDNIRKGTDIIGVAVDGVPFYSNVSKESTVYGKVLRYKVNTPGDGYVKPTVFTEGGAQATAVVSGGRVKEILLRFSPTYTTQPSVVVSDGRGAEISLTFDNYGRILTANVVNGGEGYNTTPGVDVYDSTDRGEGARLTTTISGGKVVSVTIVDPGLDYNPETTVANVVSVGEGCTAEAICEEWVYDEYTKVRLNPNQDLDGSNAFLFPDENGVNSKFAYLGNPLYLRESLGDNGEQHSPILGWAVDGNPIYGPYGFTNGVDDSGGITAQSSGYYLPEDRTACIPLNSDDSAIDPPSTEAFRMGTFVQDYVWDPAVAGIVGGALLTDPNRDYIQTENEEDINFTKQVTTILDRSNGKVCNTPEFPAELYPEGVFVYFTPVFGTTAFYPYVVGDFFANRPQSQKPVLLVDGEVMQTDMPESAYDDRRYIRNFSKTYRRRNPYLTSTKEELEVEITGYGGTGKGSIASILVDDGVTTGDAAVGDYLYFDNEDTDGAGASAVVTHVKPNLQVVISTNATSEPVGGEEIVTRLMSHRQRIVLSGIENEADTYTFPRGFTISTSSGATAVVGDYNAQDKVLIVQTVSEEMVKYGDVFEDARGTSIQLPDNATANETLLSGDIVGGVSTHLSFQVPESEDANAGDLFWSSASGRLYIFFDDGDTQQWVSAFPVGMRSFASGSKDTVLSPFDYAKFDMNFLRDQAIPNNSTYISEWSVSQRNAGGVFPHSYVDETGLVTNPVGNRLRYTRDWSVSWSDVNVTNSTVAIQPPNTGYAAALTNLIVEEATTTKHRIVQYATFVGTNTYTVSAYCRRATGSRDVVLSCYERGNERWAVSFSLDNEDCRISVGATSSGSYETGGGTFEVLSFSNEDVGDDWHRLTVVVKDTGPTNLGQFALCLIPDINTHYDNSYLGDVGESLYVWGTQVTTGILPSANFVPTDNNPNTAARFTHDPTTLEPLGLLIEPMVTNYATNNTVYSGMYVDEVPGGVEVTTDVIAPDGSTTAWVHGEGIGIRYITVPAGDSYTFSFFAKEGEGSQVWASCGFNSEDRDSNVKIHDWETGTTNATWTRVDYINGWSRFYKTFTSTAETNFIIQFNSATEGVVLWGPQLQAGSVATSFMFSYEGVDDTTVKSGDSLSITGTNFGTSIDEFSFFFEGTAAGEVNGTDDQALLTLSATSGATPVTLLRDGITGETLLNSDVTALDITATDTTAWVGGTNKYSTGVALNDAILYTDGTQTATDTTTNALINMTELAIGASANGGDSFNGVISRASLWASKLTTIELASISNVTTTANVTNTHTGSTIAISDTAPSRRADGSPNKRGDLWWSSYTGFLYIYNADDVSGFPDGYRKWTSEWVCTDPTGMISMEGASNNYEYSTLSAGGGPNYEDNVRVVISDTSPSLLPNGDPITKGTLWWSPINGKMYIYYVDSDTSQWVITNPTGTLSGEYSLDGIVVGDGSGQQTVISIIPESVNRNVLWVESLKNMFVGDAIEITWGTPGSSQSKQDMTIREILSDRSIKVTKDTTNQQQPIPHGAIVTNRSRYVYRITTDVDNGLRPGIEIEVTSPLNPTMDGKYTVQSVGDVDVAEGTATILDGRVVSVEVTEPGFNYPEDFYVYFNGGAGVGAYGYANVENGQVQSVDIIEGGVNYVTVPDVVFSDENSSKSFTIFTDEVFVADPDLVYITTDDTVQIFTPCAIAKVELLSGGFGYNKLPLPIGRILRASERAETKITMDGTTIGEVEVLDGGARYDSPVAVFSDSTGNGYGATADVTVVDGEITEITVTNQGTNYVEPYLDLVELGGAYPMTTTNIGPIKSVSVVNPGRNISSERSLAPELVMDVRLVFRRVDSYSHLFTIGDEIYQGSANQKSATANIEEYDAIRQILKLTNVEGHFLSDRMIYGPAGTGGMVIMSGQGELYIHVDGISEPKGRFITDKSKVSESYPVIQDSEYYQWFSYEIASSLQKVQYETFVKDIIHPAGFQMFSSVRLGSSATCVTNSPEVEIEIT